MVEFGIRPSKLKRIPYGVDLAAAMPTFAKTVSARLRLGFIGTLTRHKGAHVLLQAIRQLPPEAPINALVFGDLKAFPEYGNHLRELAGEDLRIQFRGEFPRDQIGTVLAEIDVLVVPSIWNENTPLVVYSAQASGTPVVASNVAGLNEVIEDGKNGLLFEMGNPEELAGVISRLEGNRSLIRRLARESVKPKSISQYVDDLQVVYAEILAERKTMP
jgi:glycosyltransferase involved in cell wall biosynthesis